jgi:hypothetical protein
MHDIIIAIIVFIGVLVWNHYNIKKNPVTMSESDIIIAKDIEMNAKNKDLIRKELNKTLLERMDLLKSGKMGAREWIDYNTKNKFVKINDGDYYIFIHEHLNDSNNFICRCHANPKYVDLLWSDIIKEQNEQFVTAKYNCDPDLVNEMFNTSKDDSPDSISYFWNDPITNKQIKKHSIFLAHDKTTKDKDGHEYNGFVIGTGYTIENLSVTYQTKYYNKLNNISFLLVILTVLGITFLLNNYKIFPRFSNAKSFLFLFGSLIYILYYTNTTENLSCPSVEKDKMDNINSGILSISFLIGVNIFIISTLQHTKTIKLNQETSVIFSVSLLLLMFSIFKKTNYTTTDDLIRIRISNQFAFNYSIILNIMIIINYLLFIYFFGNNVPEITNKGNSSHLYAL